MHETAPPRRAPAAKVRLLIVDADPDSRESLCSLVSGLGHTVCHAAEPGPPTLDRLAEADPDLTLIGLRPGAAAGATLETAERIADRSRAPIVYVTESTDAALLDGAQQAHPRGFVLKSAGAEQLDLTIRTALSGAARVVGHEKGNRELLLLTLFDSMTDAMVIADADGRIVAVNPAARKVVDTTISTDPNEWVRDYDVLLADGTPVAPGDRPIARALRGETTAETVVVLRPRRPEAGTAEVRLAASGYPLVDADGRRVGGAVLLRSATDAAEEAARAKRFESELHERVQVLDAIIHSMGDGVVVADAEMRFTLSNPSAERIAGIGVTDRPPEEWTELYGVFYPDGTTPVPTDELGIVRAVRGESVQDLELFIRNPNVPDGVHISVNASPVRDASQKVVGGVAVFRDVSERRMQEEALTQAFAHGRLEVIDDLLHNIGNAINSVATGVDTLYGWFEDNELVRRFDAVSTLAEAHESDWTTWLEHDPQGRKVRPFLVSLVRDLTRQQDALRQTVTRVRERVRHIEDILRTQASFTDGSVKRKAVDLPRTIGDAVKVVEASARAQRRRGRDRLLRGAHRDPRAGEPLPVDAREPGQECDGGDLGTPGAARGSGRGLAADGPTESVPHGAPAVETAERIVERFGVPLVYATETTDAELLDRAQRTDPHGYVLKSADSRQLGLAIRTALEATARQRGDRQETCLDDVAPIPNGTRPSSGACSTT